MQPAEAQIRDWMKALAALIAPAMSGEEIRARIDALTPNLAAEFAPDAFCQASLTHTARLCRFFPNFAELCEHLAAWKRSQNPYPIYGGSYGAIESPTSAWPKLTSARGAQDNEERRWASETVRNVAAQLAAIGDTKREVQQAAPKPLPLSRAQLVQAYKQAGVKGPQIPEPTPLRAAATTIPTEVRRGKPLDA